MANLCRMRVPHTGGHFTEASSAAKRPRPGDLADLFVEKVQQGTVLFFPSPISVKTAGMLINSSRFYLSCIPASPSWSICHSLSCVAPPTTTPYGRKSWTLSSAPCHASPPLCDSVSNGEHARRWTLPCWQASCILALCNNQYVRRNMFGSGGEGGRRDSSWLQERGEWSEELVGRMQSENIKQLTMSPYCVLKYAIF